MKTLLLATVSAFVLAGAAAAEVTFAGTATLGYNDDDLPETFNDDGSTDYDGDDNFGFYWDGNVAVTLSQELDNGVTAGVTFDFDFVDNSGNGIDLSSSNYVLSLTADMGGLYFGDTAYAAETYWSGIGDMEADGFSEADGETILRAEVIYGGISAGVSYVVADGDGNIVSTDNEGLVELEQLSVGANGAVGNFSFALAYQEAAPGIGAALGNDDFNDSEIFAISASTSFSGADIAIGYASNEGSGIQSTGVRVAYPLGPVTLTAYYVMEDADGATDPDDNFGVAAAYSSGPLSATLDYQDDQGVEKIDFNATYDIGNGLSVLAGYYTEDGADDEFYVAGIAELGGGADFTLVYAEGNDDEVGNPEYEPGITAELTLEF